MRLKKSVTQYFYEWVRYAVECSPLRRLQQIFRFPFSLLNLTPIPWNNHNGISKQTIQSFEMRATKHFEIAPLPMCQRVCRNSSDPAPMAGKVDIAQAKISISTVTTKTTGPTSYSTPMKMLTDRVCYWIKMAILKVQARTVLRRKLIFWDWIGIPIRESPCFLHTLHY